MTEEHDAVDAAEAIVRGDAPLDALPAFRELHQQDDADLLVANSLRFNTLYAQWAANDALLDNLQRIYERSLATLELYVDIAEHRYSAANADSTATAIRDSARALSETTLDRSDDLRKRIHALLDDQRGLLLGMWTARPDWFLGVFSRSMLGLADDADDRGDDDRDDAAEPLADDGGDGDGVPKPTPPAVDTGEEREEDRPERPSEAAPAVVQVRDQDGKRVRKRRKRSTASRSSRRTPRSTTDAKPKG